MKAKAEKTARHKLNAVYFVGVAVVAGLLGLLTDSPVIFVLTAAIFVGALLHSGSLRL
ncbi:MAG: hypothetical protein Q8M16_20295 [Pirellulaceae bacterium]|nr:hypothetical protein [Pirellulaceae bacterium]